MVFYLPACTNSNELPLPDKEAAEMIDLDVIMSELNIDINEKVTEIRMLAFNQEDRCVLNQLLSFNGKTSLNKNSWYRYRQVSDPIKMFQGTYDFLFIANETSEILSPKFRSSLYTMVSKEELLKAPFTSIEYVGEQDLEIYQQSSIPMSAYYSNVAVSSDFTSLDQPFRFPHEVSLVRAYAKLEVNFRNRSKSELTYKRVENIQLTNFAKQYSVPASSKLYSTLYPEETSVLNIPVHFTDDEYHKELIGQVVLFIPEFLRDKAKEIANPTTLLFEGKGFGNQELILEEIANFDEFKTQARLLDFTLLSTYSIIRNTKFIIDVILSDSRDLEAIVEVVPWTKVSSSQEFIDPEFNKQLFSIQVGSINYTNTQEIVLKTGEEAVITFQLDQPKNALWRASLTNGPCFQFGEANLSEGVAGKLYTMRVKATQPWSGTPNYTEFYITSRTREVPLWNSSVGVKNRYLFKQIE